MRLTVSPRALGRGGIELRDRTSGESEVVSIGEAVGRIGAGGS